MDYRYLGNSDLRCSRLALGCSHFGSLSIPKSDRELVSLVHQAVDAGITSFDTADSYGQGSSERILGIALERLRDSTVVITKAGYRFSSAIKIAARLKRPLRYIAGRLQPIAHVLRRGTQRIRPGQLDQCFDASYLVHATESSLLRLNRDAIDLFLLHSPPQNVLREPIVLSTLIALRDSGKIRHYGVSCDSTGDALLAMTLPGLSAVQISLTNEPKENVQAVLVEASRRGIGVIGRTILKKGVLSADGRVTPSVIAAAFRDSLAPEVAVGLIGTTNPRHLRDNIEAYSLAVASGQLDFPSGAPVC